MIFNLRQGKLTEIDKAFFLLKSASETLGRKNIKQWNYWKNPPREKIEWVKDGFLNNEFFFIENNTQEIMGMVRILEKDLIYWGEMNDKSKYIHSLIISEKFSGKKIGNNVIKKIEIEAKNNKYDYLRLDCDSTNKKLCEYYENQEFTLMGRKKLPLSIYNLYQKKIY